MLEKQSACDRASGVRRLRPKQTVFRPLVVERRIHSGGKRRDGAHRQNRSGVLGCIGAGIRRIIARDRPHKVLRSKSQSTIDAVCDRIIRREGLPTRCRGARRTKQVRNVVGNRGGVDWRIPGSLHIVLAVDLLLFDVG